MKKAILVIHGFVGSTYDVEYLTNYLELDRRFKVFARTLPGHDKHDNYQKCEYTEWVEFVDNWIEEIISYGYKNIYVIGHSMGGVLGAYLASKYQKVKKIVFINAAFNYLNFNQNKIDIIKNKDYKDFLYLLTKVVHTSIPFFLEFTKLVKNYADCLKNVKCESLILQSNKDQVISLENGNLIYNKINSSKKYLTYLDNEKHTIFYGNKDNLDRKKEMAEYIRIYLKGGLKWKKIWKEII